MKSVLAALASAAAVSMCAAGASASLLNPGFESPDASGGDVGGSTNWNSFNNVFTTGAAARSGTQSLKTFGPFFPGGGSGVTQLLPALPGQTWVSEVWALNASFDPIDNVDFGVLKIEFLNAGFGLAAGGLLGVDVFESNQINGATPQDVWTLLGVGSAPAPAGTAWVNIVLVKVDIDGGQGGSIFWDDVSAVPAPGAVALLGMGALGFIRRRR